MNDTIVLKSRRDNDVIIHELYGNDERRYLSVMGGVSWHTAIAPAYYCIWGEEYRKGKIRDLDIEKEQMRLLMLAEGEFTDESLDDLFLAMTDDAVLYYCEDIYANKKKKFEGMASAYGDYQSERNINLGALWQAPYEKNFMLGLSLIKDWVNKGILKIPENTIIRKEMKSVTEEGLRTSPEKRFTAINALRFVVGGFKKYPKYYPKQEKTYGYREPVIEGGWMG